MVDYALLQSDFHDERDICAKFFSQKIVLLVDEIEMRLEEINRNYPKERHHR